MPDTAAAFPEIVQDTPANLPMTAAAVSGEVADPAIEAGDPDKMPAGGGRGGLVKALTGRLGLLVLDSMTGIICARVLRPEGRGELSAMILWPVFLCQAFTFGIPSALIYRLRSKPESGNSSLSGAFLLSLLTSSLAIVFGVLVLPHWLTHYDPLIVRHAQWFMLATPISMVVFILRGVWEAKGDFGRSAFSLVGTRALTLGSLLVLIALHALNSVSAAYTYLLTGIPAVIWMCSTLLPGADWNPGRMIRSLRPLLAYGFQSYGIDLCGALSQYVDQALVLGMLSATEMGAYTVCLSLSRILNAVAIAASTVLFPRTVGATPRDAVRTALRTQLVVSVIAGAGAIGMVLLGTPALRLLYGPEYALASTTLKILILEALMSGAITIMSQPFMALGRPGVVTVLQVTGLLFSIPAILLLVPHYGTSGACVALVFSAALRLILLGGCYRVLLPGVVAWRHDTAEIMSELWVRFIPRTAKTAASGGPGGLE